MKRTDWNSARALFPALRKYVFVNAAGGAPLSRPVAEAGARYYREALEHGDAYWESWLNRLEDARKGLARLINASPQEVAFTLNTSHGMSLLSGALKGRGTVLTMQDEFPSSTLAWLNAGYKVKFLKPENGKYPVNTIEKSLTRDVKVLVTSYVQYSTGFRQDLEAVGRLCRGKGVIFVVNATQALGASLKLLSGLGVKNIQSRIFELNDYLEKGLRSINAGAATPLDRGDRSGITIIKARRPAAAVEKLARAGIMTAARGAGIRVSLHFYNNRRDIDKLISGLKKLGPGHL